MGIFLKSSERDLRVNPKDEQVIHERELKDLRAKVGELEARKKMVSSQPRSSANLLMLQSELDAEGKKVSISKLCQRFGLSRSQFYYEPKGWESNPDR
ncbi:MAG: hypothetical protein ACOH5I_06215 [Oligoflexus sp.]